LYSGVLSLGFRLACETREGLRAVEVFGRRETEMRGKDTESVSFWCCWVEREKKVKKKKKRGKSMALLQRAMSCLQREEEREELGSGKWEVGEVGLCVFIHH
jgi:hypothetical protein